MDGGRTVFTVGWHDPSLRLMADIQARLGVPVRRQNLHFQGVKLHAAKTLGAAGITHGSVINLGLMLEGGGVLKSISKARRAGSHDDEGEDIKEERVAIYKMRAAKALAAVRKGNSKLVKQALDLHNGTQQNIIDLVSSMTDDNLKGAAEVLGNSGRGKKAMEVAAQLLPFLLQPFAEADARSKVLSDEVAATKAAWLGLFAKCYMTDGGVVSLEAIRAVLSNEATVREQEAMKEQEAEQQAAARTAAMADIRNSSWVMRAAGAFGMMDES